MKKLLVLAIIIALCAPMLVSCSQADKYELALITDKGTIDDKSFNQGSWEGLVKYADEKNITHKYYMPSEANKDSYLAAIELAVEGGAKLIVTPGFLFEEAIYEAQDRWADTTFVLVDGYPNDGDWSGGYPNHKTGANVVGIKYAEEEAGFLAGYAVVRDGARGLGFMGGMAVPAVVRFGYGFVQGAEYAAQELGLEDGSIKLYYQYTGDFIATPEIQTMSAAWYNDGIDVIFGCGGGVGNSVMRAAESLNKKVVGVDIDQSVESPTVITSALKGLTSSVYACVKDYYDKKFPGGQDLILTAANDGVGLPMETSKFDNFSQADYVAIFAKLASNSISLLDDEAVSSAEAIPARAVIVTES
ncbi:MAG: BMP family ABC transporter substrate-binding protein [Oscillospiraceae bacterium]|nr:BMP family ABC transporter substrate-binding protein [Oscillospiraceae bacterium]